MLHYYSATVSSIARLLCVVSICILSYGGGTILRKFTIDVLRGRADNNHRLARTNLDIGDHLPVLATDTNAPRQRLVLVVSRQCAVSRQSVAFHKRLLALADAKNISYRIIIPTGDNTREIAQALGVPEQSVHAIELKKHRLFITPWMALINGRGVVIARWFGQVSPQRESDVIEDILRGSPHPKVPRVNSAELARMMTSGMSFEIIVLTDRGRSGRSLSRPVEGPHERHIPADELMLRADFELERTKRYVLDCRTVDGVKCQLLGIALSDNNFDVALFGLP